MQHTQEDLVMDQQTAAMPENNNTCWIKAAAHQVQTTADSLIG